MKIRLAQKDDIPRIIHHRIEMFRSMGYDDELLRRATPKIQDFMENEWDDSIKCFLATENGEVVGGCAVSVYSRLPNPRKIQCARIAYIHNVFVEPEFRRKGIATALMIEVVSFFTKRGIKKFTLHNTEMSSGLYRRLGFTKVENYYELWTDTEMPRPKPSLPG
ncbi:MAG: GNAT family N-acetyltransferase [Candidatus Thorarchaeota archaeon]|nr:MAG: GNAT family N-acetyltransferase [Candidatus Thorarchaeota archaeon]